MIDPAHFAIPADRIARMVDLLGTLSTAAAEVARAMAELLPPTVAQSEPEPAIKAVEDADRAAIVAWAEARKLPLSMTAINSLRLDLGLRPFRMIRE